MGVQGACIPVVPGWLLKQYRKAIHNNTLEIRFDTYLSNRNNEPVWNFIVKEKVGGNCCVLEFHGNPDGALDYIVPKILKRDKKNHDTKLYHQRLESLEQEWKASKERRLKNEIEAWAKDGRDLMKAKADGLVSCPGSTISGARNGELTNTSGSTDVCQKDVV